MISWTCVMAGGPDHGEIVSQWVPIGKRVPEDAVASDGVTCRPVVVAFNGDFCHAVFMHPGASARDLEEAENDLHTYLGVTPDECGAPDFFSDFYTL